MNPLLKLKCLRILKGTKLDFTPKVIVIGSDGHIYACNCPPIHDGGWWCFPKGTVARSSIMIGKIDRIGDEESSKSILVL